MTAVVWHFNGALPSPNVDLARRAWRKQILVLTLALLTACAPVVESPLPPAARVPDNFPADFYRRAIERGEPVFRIDAERSEAIIHVYRGGALARLGHDHVVASRNVHGYLLLTYVPVEGRADLYVPLDSMTVDEPMRRTQAGFAPLPPDADIAGTRRNMLEKVLDAERYPFALIHLGALERDAEGLVSSGTLTLRDVTRPLRVPVEMNIEANALHVSGRFSLRQSDFGMTPFSVLGGALQVQDRVDVAFRIVAIRITSDFARPVRRNGP